MTTDIYSLKKELDILNNKLIIIKNKINKNNLIIYLIFTIIFLSTNIFKFNIYTFLINSLITFILENIISLIINNNEYKNIKNINHIIKNKQQNLNKLIQKEITNNNIKYISDINAYAKLNNLENRVINYELTKDYKYNLKKVKKKVKKR